MWDFLFWRQSHKFLGNAGNLVTGNGVLQPEDRKQNSPESQSIPTVKRLLQIRSIHKGSAISINIKITRHWIHTLFWRLLTYFNRRFLHNNSHWNNIQQKSFIEKTADSLLFLCDLMKHFQKHGRMLVLLTEVFNLWHTKLHNRNINNSSLKGFWHKEKHMNNIQLVTHVTFSEILTSVLNP
jgi:hypothetical protein